MEVGASLIDCGPSFSNPHIKVLAPNSHLVQFPPLSNLTRDNRIEGGVFTFHHVLYGLRPSAVGRDNPQDDACRPRFMHCPLRGLPILLCIGRRRNNPSLHPLPSWPTAALRVLGRILTRRRFRATPFDLKFTWCYETECNGERIQVISAWRQTQAKTTISCRRGPSSNWPCLLKILQRWCNLLLREVPVFLHSRKNLPEWLRCTLGERVYWTPRLWGFGAVINKTTYI